MYTIVESPWLKKAVPIALTAVAGAGCIGTAVLAAKETPRALEAKAEAEKEKGEPLTTWESFKAMAPSYIPAAGAGAVTIASIAGMAVLNHRQYVELTGLIAGSQHIINRMSKKYTLLRNEVQEKHPEIIEEFDKQTFDDKWNEYVKNKLNHKRAWCGSRCFPDCSGEDWGVPRMFGIEYGNGLADENGHELIFFEATPGDIMTAMYNLNGLFHTKGIVYVNDLFNLLNLPKTQLGDMLVWDPSVLYDEWESDWIGIYTEDWEMEDNVPQPAIGTVIRFHIPPLAEGYADGMGIPDRWYPAEPSNLQTV